MKDYVVDINNSKAIVTTEKNHVLTKAEIKQLEKITKEIEKEIDKMVDSEEVQE